MILHAFMMDARFDGYRLKDKIIRSSTKNVGYDANYYESARFNITGTWCNVYRIGSQIFLMKMNIL